MKYFFIAIALCVGFLGAASPAQAIIILPAIILIPIAKIVAVVIGAVSVPAISAGVIWQKLFGTPRKKVVFVVVTSLLAISTFLVIFLRVQNGDRPWL